MTAIRIPMTVAIATAAVVVTIIVFMIIGAAAVATVTVGGVNGRCNGNGVQWWNGGMIVNGIFTTVLGDAVQTRFLGIIETIVFIIERG